MKSTTFAELRALTSSEMSAPAAPPPPAATESQRAVGRPLPVQPPAPPTETTRLELTIEGFTLDQLSTIRAELQAAPRSRRRGILRKYQTTEVKWRIVERQWASHLRELEARPEQLVLVATSLQRKGKRRRSRTAERTT
jgi:hypothetical protein